MMCLQQFPRMKKLQLQDASGVPGLRTVYTADELELQT